MLLIAVHSLTFFVVVVFANELQPYFMFPSRFYLSLTLDTLETYQGNTLLNFELCMPRYMAHWNNYCVHFLIKIFLLCDAMLHWAKSKTRGTKNMKYKCVVPPRILCAIQVICHSYTKRTQTQCNAIINHFVCSMIVLFWL